MGEEGERERRTGQEAETTGKTNFLWETKPEHPG